MGQETGTEPLCVQLHPEAGRGSGDGAGCGDGSSCEDGELVSKDWEQWDVGMGGGVGTQGWGIGTCGLEVEPSDELQDAGMGAWVLGGRKTVLRGRMLVPRTGSRMQESGSRDGQQNVGVLSWYLGVGSGYM